MHRIEPIHGNELHIPTIARWHWDEWGHADPEGSLETWEAALHRRTSANGIPILFVALASEEPIGSVALVRSDMSTHPELGPWLAGLYVVPAGRGQGLGSKMAQHATDAATRMGYSDLYLHTSTATSLYSNLGWRKLHRERYEGEVVDVMHITLNKKNGG